MEKIWNISPGCTQEEMAQYRATNNMDPATFNYLDPTPEMLENPMWLAIWNEIKTWDINVPTEYVGYTGATGNHVTAIYQAIQNSSEPTPAPHP